MALQTNRAADDSAAPSSSDVLALQDANGMNGPGYRSSRHAPHDRNALPMLEELSALHEDRARLKAEVARLEGIVSELSTPSPSGDASGDLGKLLLAARRLDGCADRGAVLDALQEIVRQMIGADDFLLLAHDEEGRTLWPMLGIGPNGAAFGPLAADDDLVVNVLRTGRRIVSEPTPDATGAARRFEALACIPLKSSARTVGILVVFGLHPRRGALTALDLELLDFLTVHAATALQLADLRAATVHRARSLL
jgi:hypothetical protein